MGSWQDIRDRTRDWVDAGIVDAAQAERIVAFERDRDQVALAPAASARARMQALFGVLGGLLIGLGILLTVATNWADIADPLKVAIVIGSMLVAYVLAFVADERGAPRWAGTVAWVVGIGLFAAGLVIIGLVYNVQSHEPFAALLVALAATALAFLTQRLTIGWVAATAWLVWGAVEYGDSLGYLDNDAAPFLLGAGMVLLGVTALAASFALEPRALGRVLALPLRVLSLLLMLLVLVQAGFAWHMEEEQVRTHAPTVGLVLLLVAALVAVALLLRYAVLEHRRALAGALVAVAALAMLVALVQQDLLVAIVASVVLGLGGIGLVLLGLVDSRSELFALGIAWLVALVITRYLDFVFSVELGGPGFIGAGVLLLGIAWLVGRSRRLWSRREEVLG